MVHNRSSIERLRLSAQYSKFMPMRKKLKADGDLPPGDDAKNPAAVALGRLGGLKGGRARAESLSDEQRSGIARKAALARWKKEKRKE